jgi:uncharacterized secreted protein with C-terminal beta-propeller domain
LKVGFILNKKLVSIVLSVAMVCASFTACNNVSAQSDNLSSISAISQNEIVSTDNVDSDIQCYFPRENEDAEKALT